LRTLAEATWRIEWPSGIVQELKDVTPRQILMVQEPAGLAMPTPGELRVTAWSNMVHRIEGSVDLREWTPLATVTNQTRVETYSDPGAGGMKYRFYRAVKP
jgi:hypothetical protein